MGESPQAMLTPPATCPFAGSTSAVPVNGIDWYPTLLELVGLKVPKKQQVDGVSLVPLLKGKSIPGRPLYWHYPHYGNQGGEPSSIITEDDWKLIHYHEDGRDELYHLGKDEVEQKDLAAAEPKRVKAMRVQLDVWLKATKAKMPVKDEKADLAKRKARFESLATQGKERLERQHANFLNPDYKPNKDWWGSATKD
jgi:arylsulfatase A-like enzyme